MNEKITSKEILEQFAQKSGLSEEQSNNFFDTFQYVFLQAIEKDKTVKISGLGTFQLVWNKPRKSVDVRTQQEIEIAGHYKLIFTPENALKERVNAEFAHLEPKEIEQPQQKVSPIEKLAHQAVELKEILVDIMQDNKKNEEIVEEAEIEENDKIEAEEKVEKIIETAETEEVTKVDKIVEDIIEEQKIEEKDVIIEDKIEENIEQEPETSILINEQVEKDVIIEEKTEEVSDNQLVEAEKNEEINIEQEQNISTLPNEQDKKDVIIEEKTEEKSDTQPAETEVVEDEKTLAQRQSAVDFFYQKPEPPIEVKANTFDYIENYDFEPTKRRGWLIWLIIFVVIAVSVTAFYFFQPDLAKKYWKFTTDKTTELTHKVGGWFSKPQSADIQQDTIVLDTVATDIDTVVEPIETPEISIFDVPRNYTEFIETVTMYGGNTLVKLSEKYYGNKVFWVYIYEANKDRIAHPDNISAGQTVKIPKLNEKLIDAQNPACLEYAQRLHNEYVK